MNEIVKLSREKGFVSRDMLITISESYYYLWMCELQRWLREFHNIHVVLKPIMGSKNGYDSFPMLGWGSDVICLNKNSENSYYMGYPIGDWFTASSDNFDEGDTLEDFRVNPLRYEEALELGLIEGLKLIK